ncbi:hypothetical protein K7X08_013502 [Anisodus acutangulus]|uniref:Aminoacyl-transfer RNA synthetases class-II family profile domain-containing protein n=1 Tax=Anisodus acutangulus TaxID=402998 RepID=A0A9Q1LK90_9SOLA|nr:hypothetical protein K7X08_013502 [Anisodus acutangulus]
MFPEELGAKIKEYDITSPDTKNPLSEPYPFNLMFHTSIGPSGVSPGYMRPETAQGIFVNFKDLYYYNGNKLPFAAAQIGQAFRNEISLRQGLLRVREFTLAEIEHFVDPEDKSHPKFPDVANLEFLMFPREDQVAGKSARRIPLGDTIAREKSGVPLGAHEKFPEPKEVEKLIIAPVKKELGLAFKGNQKMVVEALEAMGEKQAMEMKSTLESKGEAQFHVCTLDKVVTINKNMVSISKEKRKEHQRGFTPSVIEPSFGIGRIIYCLYEHSFYTRPSRDGNEQLNVFRFPHLVAPIKCTVFPLVQNQQYEEVVKQIARSLAASEISYKIDITVTISIHTTLITLLKSVRMSLATICCKAKHHLFGIGKKYTRTDELGVRFAITVDSTSSVTVRERDSKQQIPVNVDEVASVIKEVTDGQSTWADVLWRYPTHSS